LTSLDVSAKNTAWHCLHSWSNQPQVKQQHAPTDTQNIANQSALIVAAVHPLCAGGNRQASLRYMRLAKAVRTMHIVSPVALVMCNTAPLSQTQGLLLVKKLAQTGSLPADRLQPTLQEDTPSRNPSHLRST
jgi:hypothetical protein